MIYVFYDFENASHCFLMKIHPQSPYFKFILDQLSEEKSILKNHAIMLHLVCIIVKVSIDFLMHELNS